MDDHIHIYIQDIGLHVKWKCKVIYYPCQEPTQFSVRKYLINHYLTYISLDNIENQHNPTS